MKETVIAPGLYRILPQDPKDATKGPYGAENPLLPMYATAPPDKDDLKEVENLGPITLNAELGKGDRQVWRVGVVDEENRIYTITRADGIWLGNERAPSFGFDGFLELRKPISCMGFKEQNPFKWKILHAPPVESSLQQAMFAILPVPLRPDHELLYFIDDQTPKLNVSGEGYDPEHPRPPEPAMVINKVGLGVQAHTWYFEPYFQIS